MSAFSFADVAFVAPSGTAPFDPLSFQTWLHAFWADDPSWTNPGNGNGVSSWRNAGSSANAATQATGSKQPLFRSSVSQLNNRAAVEFDGTDDTLATSSAGTTTNPHTTISVIRSLNTAQTTVKTIYDRGGAGNQTILSANSSTTVRYFAGTSIVTTGSVAVGSPMFVVVEINGASSRCLVNGTDVSNGNPGTGNPTGMTLGSQSGGTATTFGNFQHALHLRISGTLSAPDLATLLAWSQAYYGTP